ncbi:MAG: polyphenol oxidase family protein, partial [Nocardioides sp.]|nr:polyphenol oxidase family protein [Nocardioides sp.]
GSGNESQEKRVVGMRQVHGSDVHVLDAAHDGSEIVADGIITREAGVTLLVRAADCVPLLLADPGRGVIGAVHSGRPGLVAGVVPRAVAAMRELGAEDIVAWLGPHVCGGCYEVPEGMRADVSRVVPEAYAETSWGTPAVDIGAGVRAQLVAGGVRINEIDRCTMEDQDLWSYRREGTGAGRLGGLIRIRP